MVSCKTISALKRIPLIGDYLPPTNIYHILHLDKALNTFLGRYPIVVGYLNAYIGRIMNPWNQQVADFLNFFGLVDL